MITFFNVQVYSSIEFQIQRNIRYSKRRYHTSENLIHVQQDNIFDKMYDDDLEETIGRIKGDKNLIVLGM